MVRVTWQFYFCSFDQSPDSALVTFAKLPDAQAAMKSEKAILDNRFIQVSWHKPPPPPLAVQSAVAAPADSQNVRFFSFLITRPKNRKIFSRKMTAFCRAFCPPFRSLHSRQLPIISPYGNYNKRKRRVAPLNLPRRSLSSEQKNASCSRICKRFARRFALD